MQYTLRNYTKRTFTQQELLSLQDKGVRFSHDDPSYCPAWNFNSNKTDFYAVSESSMQRFLSLVEGAKKEATETLDNQFSVLVPLTEMQLKVVCNLLKTWENRPYDWHQDYEVQVKEAFESEHDEIIEEMKQEAAEKAMKAAEEARRKAEEENDYVIVDTGTTFEHDQRKFAFVQVGGGRYKIFLVQDGKIGWNRFFDEEFHYHQKVKISSLFKNQ